MIGWIVTMAHAQTTYNLPNASIETDGLTTSIGVGVAALRAGPLPSLRSTVSFNQSDVRIFLTNTVYQGVETEGFDVLSARYLLLKSDRIRFAPTLMVSDHWGGTSMDYRLTVRTGFALETGQNQWLWDLSANIAGWHYRPDYEGPNLSKMTVFDTVLALETGLRYEFKDGHFCRLGLLGPLPSFRYAVPTRLGVLEMTGATLGTQHLLQIDFRH